MSEKLKILIVDDKEGVRKTVLEVMEDMIYLVRNVPSVEEALHLMDEEKDIDLVFIRDIAELEKAEKRAFLEIERRKNVIINTSHLLLTPLTIVRGNMELVQRGLKEMTPELADLMMDTLNEMYRLIHKELYEKMNLMTVETSDGFTPVKKKEKKEGSCNDENEENEPLTVEIMNE